MSALLNVVKLTCFVILINIISILCVVLWGFKTLDVVPAAITGTFSVLLLLISFCFQRLNHAFFKNFLAFCVMVGGASAFFWFFQIIYNIGFYIDVPMVAVQNSCACAMTFLSSVYLMTASYQAYLYLMMQKTEKLLLLETSPLIVTELAANYTAYQEKNKWNNGQYLRDHQGIKREGKIFDRARQKDKNRNSKTLDLRRYL